MQAVAALRYAAEIKKPLNFHINGTRVEMNGTPILRNISQVFDHLPEDRLILHNWEPHDKFLILLRDMDIVMQVSFSETFNIVAADAVVSGVPIVVSEQVSWASPLFQAQENSSKDIASKMGIALALSGESNLYGLEEYNKLSIQHWLSFMGRF